MANATKNRAQTAPQRTAARTSSRAANSASHSPSSAPSCAAAKSPASRTSRHDNRVELQKMALKPFDFSKCQRNGLTKPSKSLLRKIDRDLKANRHPMYYAMKYGYTVYQHSIGNSHYAQYLTDRNNEIFKNYLFQRFHLFGDLMNLGAALLLDGFDIGLDLIGALINKRIRHLKRPRTYEQEAARRHELAAARRRITRRRTTNDCPSPDAIRDAWAHRKDSPAAILRLGSLLEDLECHVDNSLRFNKTHDKIIGREGGIKGFFRDNIPELVSIYKNVIRYKALARKLRQAAYITDPDPLDHFLPPVAKATASSVHASNAASSVHASNTASASLHSDGKTAPTATFAAQSLPPLLTYPNYSQFLQMPNAERSKEIVGCVLKNAADTFVSVQVAVEFALSERIKHGDRPPVLNH